MDYINFSLDIYKKKLILILKVGCFCLKNWGKVKCWSGVFFGCYMLWWNCVFWNLDFFLKYGSKLREYLF